MGLTVILEGIAVQRAGELLFDVGTAPTERASSRRSYLRALEDVSFALLFAEKVATASTLATFADAQPGKMLVDEFPGRFVELDVVSKEGPKDLLVDPVERPFLEDLVRVLDQAYHLEPDLWCEHMIREVRHNLGRDPSILTIREDPSEYRFEKNFWPDRRLQRLVPAPFVKRMLSLVSKEVKNELIPSKVLEEFLTRNVVAHIAIFLWYQRSAERSLKRTDRLRLPWGTRSSLLEKLVPRKPYSKLWKIRRLVMPYVLTDLLEQSSGRSDARQWLQDYSIDKRFRDVRERLASAVASFALGHDAELQKLARAIEEAARQGEPTEKVGIAGELGVTAAGPSANLRISREWERRTAGGTNPLTLVLRLTHPSYSRYEAAAVRVFPELGG